MDTLRLIVQSILIIIFITAFLEIVLPNNDMKGYINLIIGLFIIVAVLNPFLGLINKGFNFDILKDVEPTAEDTQALMNKGRNLAAEQKSRIAESYKGKLSRQVMALLGMRSDSGITGVDVEIVEDPNNPNFGQVKKIVLHTDGAVDGTVKVDDGEMPASEINVEDIGQNPDPGENLPEKSDPEKNDRGLREMVADFYGLTLEQVEITQ